MMLKPFETKVAQSPENMFVVSKYEAAKISGVLKTIFSESTLGLQREITFCVTMLSNQTASVTVLLPRHHHLS